MLYMSNYSVPKKVNESADRPCKVSALFALIFVLSSLGSSLAITSIDLTAFIDLLVKGGQICPFDVEFEWFHRTTCIIKLG